MSTFLRKCIDIAPTAVVTPGPAVPMDYRNLRQQSWWTTLRKTTSHLRLWADWPSLQPVAGSPPGGAPLAALDAQVDAAYADGMQIIMLPYRYPKWANGTDQLVFLSEPDSWFFPQDRVTRLAQYLDWRAGLRARPGYKAHEYRMPPDGFGPDSKWCAFVTWLWNRYADRLAAFEVVNEPNGQLWPQRSTRESDDINVVWGTEGTELLTTPAVAEMMATVDALARSHSDPPLLLAPSCSDSLTVAPRVTTTTHANPYPATPSADPFAESLLRALARRSFDGGERWVWSYHNYSDIEQGYQHVVYLRRALIDGGWTGRQLDGGPEVWCTEGGARINQIGVRFGLGNPPTNMVEAKRLQGLVITEALSRHHYAKGAGAGVGLLTQYTTYSEGINAGILEPLAGAPVTRPSYDAWCGVPEYHPASVQRAAWRPQF